MNEESISEKELEEQSTNSCQNSNSEQDDEEVTNSTIDEQSSLKDGYLVIIKSFIESSREVDQDKLSPQFLAFINKLTRFVDATENNYSFRYVFDVIAQHIKAIIYVNISAKDILGEDYSVEKYNNILSALVSSCDEIIDTFIVQDIVINIEQADAYAVSMPYVKVDELLNERIGFELNIIAKSVEHYTAARRKREEEYAKQQALVMQVMMLLGGLDYKNNSDAKKILIRYWPSKVNIPKKLNLNKVQQLSSIVATDLIVSGKSIQDFISEFNLDPELLDVLKFTEEDLAMLNPNDVTPELENQLNDENEKIENMKQELIKDKD